MPVVDVRRLLAVSALLLALTSSIGCRVVTPAGMPALDVVTEPPPALAENDWPVRRLDAPPMDVHGRSLVPLLDMFIDHGRVGRGTLLEWPEETLVDMGLPDGERHLLFVTDRLGVPSGGRGTLIFYNKDLEFELAAHQNVTFIVVFDPEDGRERRGLAIYLSGVAGVSDPERKLLRRLTSRGWRVMAVTPSSDLFMPAGYALGLDNEAIDRTAQSIAASIDNHLAERVYAVQAGLEHLAAEDGDETIHRDEPMVLIGASAGAIALPAIAAGLPRRPDAAVLIAGGAPFFRIIRESPVARDQFVFLRLDRGAAPMSIGGKNHYPTRALTEAEWAELEERALRHSRLDPHRLAPLLRDVPVLQLHARFDAIVPSETGDVLYERLGRPERWTYAAGHIGLFFMLHFEAGRIVRWIEARLTWTDGDITQMP